MITPPPAGPVPDVSEAAAYDVFLSYHRADREAAFQLRSWLETHGVRSFIDADLSVGLPWVKLLEGALEQSGAVAVLIGPSGFGNWQLREIWWALDRQTKLAASPFPVIPILLPGARPPDNGGFLPLNSWVDLRNGLGSEEQLSVLANAVRNGKPAPSPRPQQCPYRGLLSFTEGDAPFFCGREELTKQLFHAVRARNLVAVVAGSGSGKSSLVLAGLAPLLRRQKPPDTTWDVAIARPGDRPWRRLADSLMPLLEPDAPVSVRLERAGSVESALKNGALPECIDRALTESGGADKLLLVVDQFEELFTLTPAAVRDEFLSELLRCVKPARMTLVLVVRGDFYGQAIASHRGLSDALESRVLNVAPMRPEELRAAIEQPAARVGLAFETGLVNKILDDVASEPGNLPLLQFGLTQLWNERRGSLLTHEGYVTSGGLKDAIAMRAERIWAELEPAEQQAVRRLFTRLVRLAQPEDSAGDTRRRVRRRELSSAEWEMAQKLAGERLLVTDCVENEDTVEVAHEALIRHWDRLRTWLDSDREFFLWRQRLDAAISLWKVTACDETSLLRGRLLEEAMYWRQSRNDLLSEEEAGYISSGQAVRAREDQQKIVQSRNTSRLRTLFVVVPVLALGLAGAVFVALRQTAVAASRELAASAKLYLDPRNTDRSLPVFLALQAVLAAETREAEEALQLAVQTVGKPAVEGSGGAVNAIAFSSSGGLFAAGWDDGSLQLRAGPAFVNTALALKHPTRIVSLAFAPDGRSLAAAGGQSVTVWESASGNVRQLLIHQCSDVMGVVFVLGGSRIVTGCNDGTLSIWDAGSGARLQQVPHATPILGIAADTNGERFATAMGDGKVMLWGSQDVRPLRVFDGAQDAVESIAFHPDGTQIAAGVKDGTAILWETGSGHQVRTMRAGPTALASVTYSPDGRYLAGASLAGRATLWDAASGRAVLTLDGPPEPAVSASAAAFDPVVAATGRRLALAGAAGVRVFDLELDRLRQHARTLLTRPFTVSDCRQYMGKNSCSLTP